MVVHRQTEQHREEEQRQPDLDELDLYESESPGNVLHETGPGAGLEEEITTMPYAAPTDRRLRRIAFTGSTIERNTTVNEVGCQHARQKGRRKRPGSDESNHPDADYLPRAKAAGACNCLWIQFHQKGPSHVAA